MREHEISARDMIHKIAKAADLLGSQAGVGGVEIAGQIISHLDMHPENIEPFLNGGINELPDQLYLHGNLSWHSQSGKVMNRKSYARSKSVSRLGALGKQLGDLP